MNKLDFMDILSIMSFAISVENLDSNIDQDNMQQLLGTTVNEIHQHLDDQDKKLDKILEVLYAKDKETG